MAVAEAETAETRTPQKSKKQTIVSPASNAEIMQALSPYITSGPSGLAVRIGTTEISLRREQRRFTAPRNTDLDTLIEAAVDMSGPLTPEEAEKLIKPYEDRGISMKIEGDMVYLTRKPHIASIRTGENKIKQIPMKARTVSSSLDVPMAHITNVLNELVQGGEVFE
jgi:hypothetical protein